MTEPDRDRATEQLDGADPEKRERADSDAATNVSPVVPAEPELPVASNELDAINDGPTSADYSTAFSPRNVAVGLAIVAGLVALAASRRRKRRAVREDD